MLDRYVLARNNLGLVHHRLGRPSEAAAEWRRALAADPGSALVLSNLAMLDRGMAYGPGPGTREPWRRRGA